jgi:hypothetical protein
MIEHGKQESKLAKPARKGRPIKPVRKGFRYQIGVIVSGATKMMLAREAKNTGRTISREVESMIEAYLLYRELFPSKNPSLTTTIADAGAYLLWRHGYTRVEILNPKTGQRFPGWAEPGMIETPVIVCDEKDSTP